MNKGQDKVLECIGKWKFPYKKFSYEREILLKQTNVFGNTYFANYIEWQGEAREKLLLQHPAARDFLAENRHLMLITYCVYHKFIKNTFFGDKIRIEVTARDIQKFSLILVFHYRAVDGSLIGEGWQKVCFSDLTKNQMCPVPQLVLDLVEPVLETPSDDSLTVP